MNHLKTLLLLGFSLVLVSCGGQQTTTPTAEAPPTTESSPTAEASPTTESSPMAEASPTTVAVFIPIAIFEVIDVNKDGSVTEEEYVTYYVEKADPKMTKEEAKKKFEELKPKDGKITKDMAK